ncbi:hypothetical protein OHB26_20990 [Nocardia sp. NBC_01503]|uniref:hypothetical protein n=1 Tax=Nocardia sp. NBC_01503 TaxID=2975997 RepID=UPI002E7B4476|nr:hypothetical protein [Nocardia sp. NBC_01503]WTL29476.1 hypothetical protein OHB26_20990 [Nocardia sp. NBC_01503]
MTIATGKGRRKRCDVLVRYNADDAEIRTASLDAQWPSIGASATYWLVRFYFQHPELRDELADRRATDRIRSYGLVGPDEPIVRRTTG